MHKPEISIIIPLFNHEQYIAGTIESALSQTHTDFELIIINDGSTDASEKIVRTFTDERIKYYHQDNKGAPATINRGLDIASGDYISILNSDDIYHKKRLEQCRQQFDDNPVLIAAFTYINIIEDENISRVVEGEKDNWINNSNVHNYEKKSDFLLNLLGGNFLYTTSNLFCRKEIFKDVGMFKNYRYCHDYDFFLKLGLRYRDRIKIIKEPLLNYRFHETNTIKENPYRSAYENSLVLARLLNSVQFEKVADQNKITVSDIEHFYNSLQTWDTDRLLLSLLAATREWSEDDFITEANNADSPLFMTFTNIS